MQPEKSKRKGLPRQFSPYVYAGLGMLLGISIMAFVGFILLQQDTAPIETSLTGRTDTDSALPINDIDLSPDGKRLVVAYKPDANSENTSVLMREFDDEFNLQPGVTQIVKNGLPVRNVTFMPDGQRVLASPEGHSQSMTVRLYDRNGESWNWAGHYAAVNGDGSLLAVTLAYQVTFYNGSTGQLLHQFDVPEINEHLALSPNGEILAAVAHGAEGSHIVFYDTPLTPDDAPAYESEDFMSDMGDFGQLVFAPQGDRIITSAGENSTLYHNLMLDGATHGGRHENLGTITRIAMRGSWMAIAGTEGVQLLRYETRSGWTTLQWMEKGFLDAKNVTGVVFTPDERYLLTGHSDGIVRLWDFREGVEIKSWSM